MTFAQMDLLHHAADKSMTDNLKRAVAALRNGEIILLLDAHDRENEGDLIVAAEKITAESMNFLIKHGSGIVCLPMPKHRLELLNLHPMLPENTNSFQTAFTVSIEARHGVTTGVSAKDRAHTIKTAIADDAQASDLARPGHVFPLAAKDGGVFSRMGHTEGSVDLMAIAGLKPGAVLCELMNTDGSMTMGDDRAAFAKRFAMPVVSVEEILYHRMNHENIVEKTSKQIHGRFGNLTWHSFQFLGHLTVDVLLKPDALLEERPLTIALVNNNNLKNRYMAQVLTESLDDPFIQALVGLDKGLHDMIIVTSEHGLRDGKSLKQAAICRSLKELNVKKIASSSIGSDLSFIGRNYFYLPMCSSVPQ